MDAAALQSSAIIERANRIGPTRDSNAPLRTLIIKFLNYKDKPAVRLKMTSGSPAKNDLQNCVSTRKTSFWKGQYKYKEGVAG